MLWRPGRTAGPPELEKLSRRHPDLSPAAGGVELQPCASLPARPSRPDTSGFRDKVRGLRPRRPCRHPSAESLLPHEFSRQRRHRRLHERPAVSDSRFPVQCRRTGSLGVAVRMPGRARSCGSSAPTTRRWRRSSRSLHLDGLASKARTFRCIGPISSRTWLEPSCRWETRRPKRRRLALVSTEGLIEQPPRLSRMPTRLRCSGAGRSCSPPLRTTSLTDVKPEMTEQELRGQDRLAHQVGRFRALLVRNDRGERAELGPAARPPGRSGA